MAKNKVRIELNRVGVAELMKREETKALLNDYAERALRQLGNGYESDEYTGRNRANVSIRAVSGSARRDNAANNTLLKVVKNL